MYIIYPIINDSLSSFRCRPWLKLVSHAVVVFVLCFHIYDALMLHHVIVPKWILLKHCRSFKSDTCCTLIICERNVIRKGLKL